MENNKSTRPQNGFCFFFNHLGFSISIFLLLPSSQLFTLFPKFNLKKINLTIKLLIKILSQNYKIIRKHKYFIKIKFYLII